MSTNAIAFDPCLDFDPATVVLSHGSHGDAFEGECCLIEAANRATVCCAQLGEKYGKADQFSDDHPSISRVVRSFGISLNDAWTDPSWRAKHPDDWKRLSPYMLNEHADILEKLPRIINAMTAKANQPVLDKARTDSAAAWAAAGAAAWAAARDAAWDALYPTVKQLQDSALALFDEMIAVGR